ncbi:MAG: DUF2125 domain-containing protein [Pseudomonadota bacterium]
MTQLQRSRLKIIIPLALFVVFFVGYSIVWLQGARAVETELAAFAEREALAGRTLTFGAVRTAGYPLTLRGTVDDVVWEAPGYGTFEAETVVIAAVPYNPTRVVLAPRGRQHLTLGERRYALTSDDLRFNLERRFAAAEGHGIALEREDQVVQIGDFIANQEAVGDGQTIALSIKKLVLGDQAGTEFPYIDIAASRIVNGLNIAGLAIGVGRGDDPSPTQMAGQGELVITDDGLVNGDLELRLKNERPALELLGEANAIPPEAVDFAARVIGLMTEKGTKEVTLPLTVRESEVRLGIILLGTIPPLTD